MGVQFRLISGDIDGYGYNPYAPCMLYLPTKLGDFVRANVGQYMEHMGNML